MQILKVSNNWKAFFCFYRLILLALVGSILFSCTTQRGIRLRNKSIKEWEAYEWKQIKKRPDGQFQNWEAYSKTVKNSRFKAFKIAGIIHATPKEAVEALLYRIIHWQKFYTEKEAYFDVLENDSNDLLVYSIFKLPFPFKDRSMCERFKIEKNTNSGVYKITWHQEWEKAPAETGIVRMPIATGSWIFEPKSQNTSKATYEVYTDPGGSLPAWMYNFTVEKGLPKELDNIEDIVNRLKSTAANK